MDTDGPQQLDTPSDQHFKVTKDSESCITLTGGGGGGGFECTILVPVMKFTINRHLVIS